MALRRQLAARDAYLKPVLDLIPANATDEQVYFYIWTQEESISNRIPVPASFNLKCVKILKSWIVPDNALRLRPLTYTPVHFQDLFKFASNRNQIFAPEAIKKVNDLLDISTPNILFCFLDEIKTYPIYQQYALAVVYFLHIEHAFNKRVFLSFICDGPTPPATNESIRACWANWSSAAAAQVSIPAPTSATENILAVRRPRPRQRATIGNVQPKRATIGNVQQRATIGNVQQRTTIGNVQPKRNGLTAIPASFAGQAGVPALPTTENTLAVRRLRSRQRTTARDVQPKRIGSQPDRLIRSRWDRW